MSASTLWTTCKQTRYTELNLRVILASGTKQQRASLAAELDAECSSLSAILCEMRGLRNACRPVFALPTEVFLRIVTLLAEDCPPAWYVSGYHQRLRETMELGWLLVSHVCKAWRSTCYNAIELWPLPEDHRVAHQATLSAVTSERPELRKRLDIRIPPQFQALRRLTLANLEGLDMTETLTLLNRTPLLESLLIHHCHWPQMVVV